MWDKLLVGAVKCRRNIEHIWETEAGSRKSEAGKTETKNEGRGKGRDRRRGRKGKPVKQNVRRELEESGICRAPLCRWEQRSSSLMTSNSHCA